MPYYLQSTTSWNWITKTGGRTKDLRRAKRFTNLASARKWSRERALLSIGIIPVKVERKKK